jgi:hypothetical protein
MPLHEVELKGDISATPVENADGLKWAVVYKGNCIIALFGSEYWAKEFVRSTYISFLLSIEEVAE